MIEYIWYAHAKNWKSMNIQSTSIDQDIVLISKFESTRIDLNLSDHKFKGVKSLILVI